MGLWIAREKEGILLLYDEKPEKVDDTSWGLCGVTWREEDLDVIFLPKDLFPEVKWEDDEPTEVELKIVKK